MAKSFSPSFPPPFPSSSSMSRRNYNVFLSFRGVDVRHTFISHLHKKLRDNGVYFFKDSPELELGDRRRKQCPPPSSSPSSPPPSPPPSPSPSSPSSSSMSRRNYGVFLSFRGVDVRHTLISRLYEKLDLKGVYTFMDSPELELGDRRGELFDAIEGSRIAVITFSENYARSKWCLNELAKIMEREKLGKIVVFPIFYKVSPGEVRLHEKEKGVKGCYQLAMEEIEAKHGTEMANIWRKALRKGGDLIGEPVRDG